MNNDIQPGSDKRNAARNGAWLYFTGGALRVVAVVLQWWDSRPAWLTEPPWKV